MIEYPKVLMIEYFKVLMIEYPKTLMIEYYKTDDIDTKQCSNNATEIKEIKEQTPNKCNRIIESSIITGNRSTKSLSPSESISDRREELDEYERFLSHISHSLF